MRSDLTQPTHGGIPKDSSRGILFLWFQVLHLRTQYSVLYSRYETRFRVQVKVLGTVGHGQCLLKRPKVVEPWVPVEGWPPSVGRWRGGWNPILTAEKEHRGWKKLLWWEEKKHGSWVNLKGDRQLVTKVENVEHIREMVSGLGSVSGCPRSTPRQRRCGVHGHKWMEVSERYTQINRFPVGVSCSPSSRGGKRTLWQ